MRFIARLLLCCLLLGGTALACEHGSVARCTCGCGGTPRPYCAHKGCVCAESGIATPEAAEAVTKGCQCGCGGTPRPYCAHKGCQCASTNLETGQQAPTFADGSGQEQAVAKCSCGCGGTPRPYCAHKDCACAKAGLADPAQAMALTARCQCGCGGTPRPYCARKGCQCASTSLETGETAEVAFQDPMELAPAVKKCSCGCGGTPRPTCAYKDCVCAETRAVHRPPGRLTALDGAVRLVGDGRTTAHTTVELTNPTDQPVAYQVGEYTQFSPEQASDQALTTTEDAICGVPPGETVQARLDTVCSDVKSNPPPGPDGGQYVVSEPPAYVQPVVSVARQLASQGRFDGLPMSQCKATATVTQLALWSFAAEDSENPADQVTPEAFRDELYQQLGKQPEDLTPEQREKVDQGVDDIFEQVDFTMKQAKGQMEARVPGCRCSVAATR